MKKLLVAAFVFVFLAELLFAFHLVLLSYNTNYINITQTNGNLNLNRPIAYSARFLDLRRLNLTLGEYEFCQNCDQDGLLYLANTSLFAVYDADFAVSAWVNTSAIDMNEVWIISRANTTNMHS